MQIKVNLTGVIMSDWDQFQEHILRGQTAPADLRCLVEVQHARIVNPDFYADVFEELGLRAIVPDQLPALLDGSYLTAEDRLNPEIASNMAATEQVFAMSTMVAQDYNGNLLGYWHGPQQHPLLHAPLVRYDTEGQFSYMVGLGLVEAAAADRVFEDDDQFADFQQQCLEVGIIFSGNSCDKLGTATSASSPSPQQLHHEIYLRERQLRGLPKFDESI